MSESHPVRHKAWLLSPSSQPLYKKEDTLATAALPLAGECGFGHEAHTEEERPIIEEERLKMGPEPRRRYLYEWGLLPGSGLRGRFVSL